MGHLPKLIEDLALILMVGAFVTLLFKRIKQPLVLGYIIAGFLVGPHFTWMPTVVDTENIDTLSEIGVIFLLFSLGLEFSFKKLMRVGGAATITAFVEIIFITIAGFGVGKLLGWKTMDSLFLGGMLASSSTTIILRAFDELGVKGKKFAGIVFGILVVEDIVVILLMVLLSTIAVTNQFAGGEILMTILKLIFFLALWFIAGIFLLPSFLKKARTLLDDETLLILSIGLCLGMVYLATQVGFSAELGAFVMGSIMAETTSAEKVEHLIKPVKDLFGTVFFVSVGMMIDPAAMIKYGGPIIVVTLLTLFGKMISTTLGAILSGQPLKQSVQVGMSMAQIGEFAFIVATLGLSLGVISEFLFPIAVGASAITTFTTPYLIKFSEPLYQFLSKVLPQKWVNRINSYSASTETITAEAEWKDVLKNYGKLVLINSIVLVAILLLAINFLVPFVNSKIENSTTASIIVLLATLVLSIPFFWAIMAKKPSGSAYRELWMNKQYNHGPLLAIEIARVLVGTLLVGLFIDKLVSTQAALMVTIPVMIAVLFVFSASIQKFYQRIESRFMTNLNERETAATDELKKDLAHKHREVQSGLATWDAHIVELPVNPFAPFIGKSLLELAWREQYGINIAYIKRGDKIVHIPNRNNTLMPHDRAGILATDEQLASFKSVFEAREPFTESTMKLDDVSLQQVMVDEITRLKGKTIRSSGIREKTEGLVVGIERNNERMLNPDSSTQFEWDDIIWIVGNRRKIDAFREGEIQAD